MPGADQTLHKSPCRPASCEPHLLPALGSSAAPDPSLLHVPPNMLNETWILDTRELCKAWLDSNTPPPPDDAAGPNVELGNTIRS
jgi:hypothetical protein